jgi:uncharacterized protein YtpQ (UPF0354 family)
MRPPPCTRNRSEMDSERLDQAKAFCDGSIAFLKADEPAGTPVSSIPIGQEPVILPYGHGLLIAFVVDNGDRYKYVQQYHLDRAGYNKSRILEIGLKNLETRLAGKLTYHETGPVFVFTGSRDFEASALIVDSIWDHALKHLAPSGFAAAAPNRDVLLVCDRSSEPGLTELKAAVQRVYPVGDHPLVPTIFKRENGAWSPLS